MSAVSLSLRNNKAKFIDLDCLGKACNPPRVLSVRPAVIQSTILMLAVLAVASAASASSADSAAEKRSPLDDALFRASLLERRASMLESRLTKTEEAHQDISAHRPHQDQWRAHHKNLPLDGHHDVKRRPLV